MTKEPTSQPRTGGKTSGNPRRTFANPPLVEVALSVQFDRLAGLSVPRLGLLWKRFADRFPRTEEHHALPPTREIFGGPPIFSPEFQLLSTPPSPRLWFLNEDGTHLIQVQADRIGHNWRKQTGAETYPSYQVLREIFVAELREFQSFLAEEGVGSLTPNLCEVAYIDHVPLSPPLTSKGQLGRLLTAWEPDYSDALLGEPEEAGCTLRFLLHRDAEPVGRLYVTVQSAYRKSDQQPILLMESSARGKPLAEGLEGALAFLDFAHDKLHHCFLTITRPEIQEVWKREAK